MQKQKKKQEPIIPELSPEERSQIKRIFSDDRELIRLAQRLGQEAKEGNLKTSQLRAVFGEIRRIEMMLAYKENQEEKQQEAWYRLRMLEPKMLYRAARKESSSKGLQKLTAYLKEALRHVLEVDPGERDKRFRRFVDFMEAVVAYHKAAGGGD